MRAHSDLDLGHVFALYLEFYGDFKHNILTSKLQPRARNFPCKNPKKVGKLRALWKIMSTLLNYTNFGITLENQTIMATNLD